MIFIKRGQFERKALFEAKFTATAFHKSRVNVLHSWETQDLLILNVTPSAMGVNVSVVKKLVMTSANAVNPLLMRF